MDERTKAMAEFIDDLSNAMFGRKLSDAYKDKVCIICGKKIGEFRDELSAKEYQISGMCQECQDATFGDNDEE